MNNEELKAADSIEPAETPQTTEMVSVSKIQLDALVQAKKAAELKNAQFEQDMKDLVKIVSYVFFLIKNTKGLFSLIPVTKLTKSLVQGKMPEFTPEEIQKLLAKAKDKIVKDDSLSIVVESLITIINRYLPIFNIPELPEHFKTEITNGIRK